MLFKLYQKVYLQYRQVKGQLRVLLRAPRADRKIAARPMIAQKPALFSYNVYSKTEFLVKSNLRVDAHL